jgi:YVTN family beta-propeller protein
MYMTTKHSNLSLIRLLVALAITFNPFGTQAGRLVKLGSIDALRPNRAQTQSSHNLFFPLIFKAYPSTTYAYVTNSLSQNLSKVDTKTQTVTNTIPIGGSTFGIAVSPDSKLAYVVRNDCTNGSVIALNLTNDSIITTIPVPRCARQVAFTRDGSYAYVTSDLAPGVVSVISTTIHSVVTTINVGDGPFGIAIAPNNHAYVANSGSNTVSVIDTLSHAVMTNVPVGQSPDQVALSPDGALAYVTNTRSDTISVINTTNNVVTQTIPVGCVPTPNYTYCATFGIAVHPNGTKAYVTNSNAGVVRVINLIDFSLVTTISVGSEPQAIAITPEGEFVYVVNSASNTVSVIDTTTNQVISTITVGISPRFIAIGK